MRYLSETELKWVDEGFLAPLQEKLGNMFNNFMFEMAVIPKSELLRVQLNRRLRNVFYEEFDRFFPHDYPFRKMLYDLLEPNLIDTGKFDWQITNKLGELGKKEDPLKVICRPDTDPASWTSLPATHYANQMQAKPRVRNHVLVPTGLEVRKYT